MESLHDENQPPPPPPPTRGVGSRSPPPPPFRAHPPVEWLSSGGVKDGMLRRNVKCTVKLSNSCGIENYAYNSYTTSLTEPTGLDEQWSENSGLALSFLYVLSSYSTLYGYVEFLVLLNLLV